MGTTENEAKTIVSVALSIDNTTESIDNGTRTVAGELLEPASVVLLTEVVAKAVVAVAVSIADEPKKVFFAPFPVRGATNRVVPVLLLT